MIYCFVYEKNSKAVIFVSILHEKPIRIRRNWPRIESAYFNTANFEHSFSYMLYVESSYLNLNRFWCFSNDGPEVVKY